MNNLSPPVLHLLDLLILVFHIAFICVCLFGWVFRKTRRAHFVVVLLTAGSWFLLGMWMGNIGYCPLTDWHWAIKAQLGEGPLPSSFIKYLWDGVLPVSISKAGADYLTFAALFAAFTASIYLNFFHRRSLPAEPDQPSLS